MQAKPTTLRIWGIIIYIVGVMIGMAIAVGLFMADMEAEYYGFAELSKGRFSTLRCPSLLMQDETGTVRVKVSNPLDRAIQPIVRADISTPFLEQSTRIQITLQPGESQILAWTVDRSNVDLGNFIFVKAYIYPVYPLPLREASCGVLVLNLPFLRGGQLLVLAIISSLAGLAGGLILWARGSRPLSGRLLERTYAMLTLAILITAAILCGVMGWWLLGGILLAICILLLAAMLYLLV